MKTIEELIKSINNCKCKRLFDGGGGWREYLNKRVPNWVQLVKEKKNWRLLDEISPPESCEDSLYSLIIDTVGIEMAIRWYYSPDSRKAHAAARWLLSTYHSSRLNVKFWKKLPDEIKVDIVHQIFDLYPGEPIEEYRSYYHRLYDIAPWVLREYMYRLRDDIQYFHTINIKDLYSCFLLGLSRYIPSAQINQLRFIVESAGDNKFLELIDQLIEERRKACEALYRSGIQSTPRFYYVPTEEEQELIARVMDKFRAEGYLPAPLPQIYLSFEIPPLFVCNPELEKDFEKETSKREEPPSEYPLPEKRFSKIPRNERRRKPETISIEEVLGRYIPDDQNPQIILYQRGLSWFAKTYNLDKDLLRGIVLVHEIGHWVTQHLRTRDIPIWQTTLYNSAAVEVHEGFAQLITWWVVNELGGEIKTTFEELNRRQSSPYLVYQKYMAKPVNAIINSLQMLRSFTSPVKLQDWEQFIK